MRAVQLLTICLLGLSSCAGTRSNSCPLVDQSTPGQHLTQTGHVQTKRPDPLSAPQRNTDASHALSSPDPAASEASSITQQQKVSLVALEIETDNTPPTDPEATTNEPTTNTPPTSPQPPNPLPESAQSIPPLPAPGPGDVLTLEQVIESVYRSYPLLQGALYQRNIALGRQIAAAGAFDLKLKGATENGPTGFYQTYRQSIGVSQPLFTGGEAFAGYRIGRGDFQPWYQERQTDDGGEFKAGVSLPLLQNVDIDERRAALWAAQYGRQLAEPEIQALLIQFVQDASYAYWDWVAAGESYHIAERVLSLAVERNDRLRDQVESELTDPPVAIDNARLIAERRSKLAETRRKLDQTAAKLAIYWRDAQGQPLIPTVDQLPDFPEVDEEELGLVASDVERALQQRPELKALSWQRQILEVERAQAENLTLPTLDAVVVASQDLGTPTSKKRDKSEFELEAGVYLNVPVQRRKALGKLAELEGKLAQVSAKQRITGDKVAVDVQTARIALVAALEQIRQSAEAVRLAEDLARRERENSDAGLSDLLKVVLREQYAAESAQKLVDALQEYWRARADYRAALAEDRLGDRPPAMDRPEEAAP